MSTRVFNCTSQKHCLNKKNIVMTNDVNRAVYAAVQCSVVIFFGRSCRVPRPAAYKL